ncbi:MAG: cytochrome c [Pseudomonadales bacterium]|jgi:mono/diheme cytochrome c family protein|nr:cytochrome c [Pseudomonadales bacterium]
MSFRTLLALTLLGLAVLVVLQILRPERAAGSGPVAGFDLDDPSVVERGAYLALAGNCASCHRAPDGASMAGGLAFETPFGTIHATNITPDPETGIGRWTDRDFLDAMRHGVRPNGDYLYPVFPYTAFTKVTDEDVAAIFAYLRSLPPVRRQVPENDLAFPFAIRSLMAFWNALFFEAGAFEADPAQPEAWNRGAYLVESLAHCSACHSPRNLLGAEQQGLAFSGGTYLDRVPGGAHRPWSAPNLTASDRGLGLWSREDLAAYLKHGRNGFLESFGPMNEVIMNSTRHLSGADIDAMALYLVGLPAIDEADGAAPEERILGRGRTVYNLHCGTCHLPTGEGDPEMAPRLNAGSLVVQSEDPASMINAILYGPEPPEPPLPPKWRHPMEEFQYLLDDEEIAAVATYVRRSWGNAAGVVTAEQVARQR